MNTEVIHVGNKVVYIERSWYDDPVEAEQIEKIQQSVFCLRTMVNPSELVQQVAVRRNGFAVLAIKRPSPQIVYQAIQQNGLVILCFENPPADFRACVALNTRAFIDQNYIDSLLLVRTEYMKWGFTSWRKLVAY